MSPTDATPPSSPQGILSDAVSAQPELWRRRAAAWEERAGSILGRLEERPQRVVVGRGSSAHAARFAVHLEMERSGRPALQLDPSFLEENPEVDASWSDARALIFSASGETAEVTRVAEHLRMWGAQVVGITSAGRHRVLLDDVCDEVLRTGVESDEVDPLSGGAGAAFFAAAALTGFRLQGAVHDAADDLEHALADEVAERVAARIANARSVAWVGDGPLYPAAQEAAAQLRLCSRLPSAAWSTAELVHQPAQFLGPDDLFVVLTHGAEPTLLRRALRAQLGGLGAELLTVGEVNLSTNEPADEPLSLTGPLWSSAPVFLGLTQRVASLLASQGRVGAPWSARVQHP